MLAWTHSLRRAGLLTAILSNMVPEVLRTMRQEFAWLADFNQLTWSCELGIAKPDPAIYHLTCDKLGVAPAEALFLDDKIENVRAAEQLGLQALQFRSIQQLHTDLAARNLLDKLPDPVPA
jgi:putative hydrolase of the HAD superfamily